MRIRTLALVAVAAAGCSSTARGAPGAWRRPDRKPRGDAKSCAAGERAIFTRLEAVSVDMKDLAVNVFGEVAIATFNGHFMGRMNGNPIAVDQQSTLVFVKAAGDWKVVHEHFSLIGAPPQPQSRS